MSELVKVWGIGKGEYSDYYVERVFATRELAEAYIEAMGEEWWSKDRRVEEYTLESELPPITQVYGMRADIDQEGRTVNHRETRFGALGQDIGRYREAEGRIDWSRGWYATLPLGHVVAEGTDQERVRKVFSEKLARALEEFKFAPWEQKGARS